MRVHTSALSEVCSEAAMDTIALNCISIQKKNILKFAKSHKNNSLSSSFSTIYISYYYCYTYLFVHYK